MPQKPTADYRYVIGTIADLRASLGHSDDLDAAIQKARQFAREMGRGIEVRDRVEGGCAFLAYPPEWAG